METVLFTESSMNVGGQERQFLQQISALKALNIPCILACKRNSRVYEFAQSFNVEILTFPFRNALDFETIFGLRKLIKTRKIKACVCHSGHDTNTLGIAVKTLFYRHPRIIRSRTYGSSASSLVYNWLLDQTMVPSNYMRELLLANPKINPSKIKTIYPGTDFEKLKKDALIPVAPSLDEWLKQSDSSLLLQVGMLRGEKGHITALDAVYQLYKMGHKNIRFLIAGNGPMLDAINHRIEQYELQDIVRIQEFRHIGSVLKKADLMLMPSLYEPFGLAQIEALGLGIPVIASRVGGIPETITHLETGILVEPGNTARWIKWIDYALNNKEAMKKMALKGQQFVLENFSIQKNTEELLKMLKLNVS